MGFDLSDLVGVSRVVLCVISICTIDLAVSL